MKAHPPTVATAVLLGMAMLACAPMHKSGTATAAGTERRPATLAELAGRDWVLREWRAGEPLHGKPVVTLRYAENRLVGRSGCNRYNAAAKPGATAGDIVVGPVAGTRMICPQELMAVEGRYLSALGRATRWYFVTGGDLAVGYTTEGGADATLRFSEVAQRRSD